MSEHPLDNLLNQWLAVDAEANATIAVKQVEILAAQARLDQLKAELDELLAPSKKIKQDLVAEATPYVAQLHKTYKATDGRAMFVYQKGKRSWDLDGLDALRIAQPEVWDAIKPYRRQEPDTVYVRKGAVRE